MASGSILLLLWQFVNKTCTCVQHIFLTTTTLLCIMITSDDTNSSFFHQRGCGILVVVTRQFPRDCSLDLRGLPRLYNPPHEWGGPQSMGVFLTACPLQSGSHCSGWRQTSRKTAIGVVEVIFIQHYRWCRKTSLTGVRMALRIGLAKIPSRCILHSNIGGVISTGFLNVSLSIWHVVSFTSF